MKQSQTCLFEHVLGDIWRLGFPDLDSADVELVHDLLNFFGGSPRGGSQGDDTEVRVNRLQVGYALHVRVIP